MREVSAPFGETYYPGMTTSPSPKLTVRCVVYTSQDRGSDKLMITNLALEDSTRDGLVEAFTQLLGSPVCALHVCVPVPARMCPHVPAHVCARIAHTTSKTDCHHHTQVYVYSFPNLERPVFSLRMLRCASCCRLWVCVIRL